jgi:6-pyruvoyltetrahydropterin/6-carboxytetrahydropterin synthase
LGFSPGVPTMSADKLRISSSQLKTENRELRTGFKAYLTRRYRFSASHRLHNPEMSTAENLATYGKCNNPHGHGHNYTLEVTVSGQVDQLTGMVCNLVDLDGFVEREVLSRYNFENLNTLKEFAQTVPTTENLVIEIFEILHRSFDKAHLERVRIEETMLNSFEYTGGNDSRF